MASRTYACFDVTTSANACGSGVVQLNAGDYIDFRYSTTANTGSATDQFVSIYRLSGPAVVQAPESVNGRYFSSTTGLSGSLAAITYATKGWDTHGCYSGSTWTCQVSGKYQFNAGLAFTCTATSANQSVELDIVQAGSSTQTASKTANTWSTSASFENIDLMVSDIFYCLAGDTIQVKAAAATGTPSILSSTSRNWFSWARVGN
jgi:hypothetical protein